MTRESLGILDIAEISPYTTLVRYMNGNVRPANDLEIKLWTMLRENNLV